MLHVHSALLSTFTPLPTAYTQRYQTQPPTTLTNVSNLSPEVSWRADGAAERKTRDSPLCLSPAEPETARQHADRWAGQGGHISYTTTRQMEGSLPLEEVHCNTEQSALQSEASRQDVCVSIPAVEMESCRAAITTDKVTAFFTAVTPVVVTALVSVQSGGQWRCIRRR